MGIGSWLKKLGKREDAEAIHRADERWHESPEERRVTSGDMEAVQDDALAGRSLHEGTPEDAERLAEEDV